MLVNPSGIQMDMLNSAAAGEDQAPDWIWDSAGRLTETGYTVEIRLPLRSIRFTSGENVRMGILFWRRVSRLGVSVAWPPIDAGTWVFEKHATLIVPELRPRPARDLRGRDSCGWIGLLDTSRLPASGSRPTGGACRATRSCSAG